MKTRRDLLLLLVALLTGALFTGNASVVGYVNATFEPGLNMTANPLRNGNDRINDVLSSMPEGTVVWRFDSNTQYYKDAITYFPGYGWFPASGDTNDLILPPGVGFFVLVPQRVTNTYVGEVLEGSLTNPIPANYSLKASMIPQAGLLQTHLGFKAVQADKVWRWSAGSQQFIPSPPHQYSANAWLPPAGEPSINVAESFFVHRDPALALPSNWWIRNFTVQFAASSPSPSPLDTSGAATANELPILKASVRDGKIALNILNSSGGSFRVQHSPDQVHWTTVDSDLTGSDWTGALPANERGYYRAIQP